MHLRSKDKRLVGYLSLILLCIYFLGWYLIGEIMFVLSLGIMTSLLLTIHIESYRTMQQQYQNYRQIESLFCIYSLLKISHPLPPMRGHGVSPDFARTLISLVREQKPELILEVGSGVSTILAGYCLKEIGQGSLLSLEDNRGYALVSTNNLMKHGLQGFAKVIYAPLKEVTIGDKKWRWYDTSEVKKIGSIDLLIIDGPHWKTQELARYPALPILFELLSDRAVIVLDDGFREDEKKTVEMWLEEFRCFESEVIDSEKGTIMLRKAKRLSYASCEAE